MFVRSLASSIAHSCACLFICGIVFKAGTASWGTDEGKFIRIFTLRSRPQLGATFPEYKKVSQSNVIITQCFFNTVLLGEVKRLLL